MHILIAAEIFPPDIGGPATYSETIGRELVAKNWQVQLICYSDAQQDDSQYPFPVTRIVRSRFTPLHYYRYYKALLRLAKECDVIYAMGPISSGNPAIRVAKKLQKKVVVKVVGDYAWERARNTGVTTLSIDEFQKQKFPGKIGLLQATEKHVCQTADRVIVPSNYLKKIVMGWGVSENKISVVYNSVNLDMFKNAALLPTAKEFCIISVGRLVPWKGFETLIDVVNNLRKKNILVRLDICGSGPQQKNLEEKISHLGLESSVCIMQLSHAEVAQKLMQANAFVLNTGYEGLSHTILEAMAAEVPVITTDIGGNPELVKDNVTGLLVEYNDMDSLEEAIEMIYRDQSFGQHMATMAKNSVIPQFTRHAMIEKTVSVLQSL